MHRIPTPRDEIQALLTASGAHVEETAKLAGIPVTRFRTFLATGDMPIADLVAVRDALAALLRQRQYAQQQAGGDSGAE